MRKKAYETLVSQLGKVETLLDQKMIEILARGLVMTEWEDREKWATFAQVFIELKKCGAINHYSKFQYYFTDVKANHGRVLLELLGDMVYKTDELIRLEEKILSYRDYMR